MRLKLFLYTQKVYHLKQKHKRFQWPSSQQLGEVVQSFLTVLGKSTPFVLFLCLMQAPCPPFSWINFCSSGVPVAPQRAGGVGMGRRVQSQRGLSDESDVTHLARLLLVAL